MTGQADFSSMSSMRGQPEPQHTNGNRVQVDNQVLDLSDMSTWRSRCVYFSSRSERAVLHQSLETPPQFLSRSSRTASYVKCPTLIDDGNIRCGCRATVTFKHIVRELYLMKHLKAMLLMLAALFSYEVRLGLPVRETCLPFSWASHLACAFRRHVKIRSTR